jgi:hypothetical protein
VASTNSDANGRFDLDIPPGGYTLEASAGSTYPRCPPVDATVRPGARTLADIMCDTGIR